MSTAWQSVPLGSLLKRSEEVIWPAADARYTEVTVRLWGRGVVARGEVDGLQLVGQRRFRARTGQFIASRIDARNGALGVVPTSLDGAVVTNDFPLFDVDRERLEPAFLNWLSRTERFVELCRRASEGTTNRVRLKEERFLALEVALPAVDEQRRIVERIEAIAGKVEEARRLRGEVEEEAAVLFRKRLAEQMEEGGRSWTHTTVADVIASIESGWSPQCGDAPAKLGCWGVLKTTAVQWCEFRSAENKELPPSLAPRPDLAVKCGDVLVTRAGPMKRVGVPAAVMTDHPRLMISDKIIRLRPRLDRISSRFLELALAAPLAQDHLLHRKTGLADAQVNISQEILSTTPLSYPSLSEQAEIVAALKALQASVSTLSAHQSEASELIKALLPACLDKAFRGGM